MKRITMDQLKIQLREQGIKVRPSYDHGWMITVSSALKQDQVNFIRVFSNANGISKTGMLNRLVLNYKPVTRDIKTVMSNTAGKSMAGYLDKQVGKVFGTRKNIKFTSFCLEKHNASKLNELSEYYGISRSAMIRQIVQEAMDNGN